MPRLFCVTLLLLTLGLAACNSIPRAPHDRHAHMRASIDAILGAQPRHAPGLSVAVLKDGFPLYMGSSGMADQAAGAAIDQHTVFPLFSVSKPLTAIAVMQLYERKLLALDTPIGRLLPGLPLPWHAVTVHQLLSHQSGIPNYLWGVKRAAVAQLDGVGNEALLQTFAPDSALAFAPGTRAAYCNTNYLLLAQIIARVSGRSYGSYMQENIFTPLGMHASWVSGATAPQPGKAALNYARSSKVIGISFATVGAMGVYSSAADMALLIQGLRSGKLIAPDSLATMTRPQSPHPINAKDDFYGYGWYLLRGAAPMSMFAHPGGGDGFRNAIRINHARGIAYVILGNGGAATDKTTQAVLAVLQRTYEGKAE